MKVDASSAMGVASLLPGMQFMLDRMQDELNHLKHTLGAFQQRREEVTVAAYTRRPRSKSAFLLTDIVRKNPHRPLTAYFDPTAYGLPKNGRSADDMYDTKQTLRQERIPYKRCPSFCAGCLAA